MNTQGENMDEEEAHKKLKEMLRDVHALVGYWAGELNVNKEQLSLELHIWGHWDAIYPRYYLYVLTKGREDKLFDTDTLKEMHNEVMKLSAAIREKRQYCIKPEDLIK